jgi:hypothetical protein
MCGTETDRGYNMTTSSGLPIWPFDPRPEDVRILDIAAHLSRACRFAGALKQGIEIYSVAQHSVLVSFAVPPLCALEGLLHDAAEYIFGDTPTPIKLLTEGDNRRKLEDRLDQVIRAKWGLPATMSPEVKAADAALLATEIRDLLPPNTLVDFSGAAPQPLVLFIQPMLPTAAMFAFMSRYQQLTGDM